MYNGSVWSFAGLAVLNAPIKFSFVISLADPGCPAMDNPVEMLDASAVTDPNGTSTDPERPSLVTVDPSRATDLEGKAAGPGRPSLVTADPSRATDLEGKAEGPGRPSLVTADPSRAKNPERTELRADATQPAPPSETDNDSDVDDPLPPSGLNSNRSGLIHRSYDIGLYIDHCTDADKMYSRLQNEVPLARCARVPFSTTVTG